MPDGSTSNFESPQRPLNAAQRRALEAGSVYGGIVQEQPAIDTEEQFSLNSQEGRASLIAEAERVVEEADNPAFYESNLQAFKDLVESLGAQDELTVDNATVIERAFDDLLIVQPSILEDPEQDDSVVIENPTHIVFAYIDHNPDVPPSTVAEVHQLLEKYEQTADLAQQEALVDQIETIVDLYRDDEIFDGFVVPGSSRKTLTVADGGDEGAVNIRVTSNPDRVDWITDETTQEEINTHYTRESLGHYSGKASDLLGQEPSASGAQAKAIEEYKQAKEQASQEGTTQEKTVGLLGRIFGRNKVVETDDTAGSMFTPAAVSPSDSNIGLPVESQPEKSAATLSPEAQLKADLAAYGQESLEPSVLPEEEKIFQMTEQEQQAQLEKEQAEIIDKSVEKLEDLSMWFFRTSFTESPYEKLGNEPFDELIEAADPTNGDRTAFLNLFNQENVDQMAFDAWMARVPDMKAMIDTAGMTFAEVIDAYILQSHETGNAQLEILLQPEE